MNLKRFDEALVSCDRAIALRLDYPEAYNTRGNALRQLQRNWRSAVELRQSDRAQAGLCGGLYNRGNLLTEHEAPREALADYDKAVALKPDFAEAYTHRGNVLGELKRVDEALASYGRAMEIDPDHDFLHGAWLHTKMRVCDWSDFDNQVAGLAKKVERSAKAVPPFCSSRCRTLSPCNARRPKLWWLPSFRRTIHFPGNRQTSEGNKIRLGYFSADFREHAVAALAAELFERHDRSRFEVVAFSMGPDTATTCTGG